MKCSIIIAVLDSHEVVKRQINHFNNILTDDFEVIIVDDGSDIPITNDIDTKFPLTILYTDDKRPWSQPRARNIAAGQAQGDYVFMIDVDHFLSPENVTDAINFTDDKMVFNRRFAVLDENSEIAHDGETLIEYGCPVKNVGRLIGANINQFIMKKEIFCNLLKGYDERFCGSHGGDDTDLADRYGKLHREGLVNRSLRGSEIYVFPDPGRDVKKIFHHLRWKN